MMTIGDNLVITYSGLVSHRNMTVITGSYNQMQVDVFSACKLRKRFDFY